MSLCRKEVWKIIYSEVSSTFTLQQSTYLVSNDPLSTNGQMSGNKASQTWLW